MPADMTLYPANWRELSHRIRFERAGGRCECRGECGLHRTNPGPRRCAELHGHAAKWARGKIVLTTAHLCACEPLCGDETHLRAMCQRCHLRVDVALHVRNAKANRTRKET
jgi:hypothetical protein